MSKEAIRLAEAAAAWNDARLESERLRQERVGIECDRHTAFNNASAEWDAKYGHLVDDFVTGMNPPDFPDPPEPPDDPCWKRFEPGGDPDSDPKRLKASEWCTACLRREEIHLMLRRVNVLRGARLRTLQRLAAKYRQDPTDVIRSRFMAGESVEDLAASLQCDPAEIEAALRRT